MKIQTKIRTLCALSLATLSAASGAVTLGDLTVRSAPGEPLDALLEVRDLDLSVSPLQMRVAPAAVYEREGLEAPEAAKGLTLTRAEEPGSVAVRIAGGAVPEGRLTLLIEFNAGGVITMRRYDIVATDSAVTAEPVEARVRMGASVPKVEMPQEEAESPAEKPEGEAQPRRKGRYGPNVVRDYVKTHGFDAAQPMTVERDMTFWSILKLYWAAYEGATAEQVAVAFFDKNPQAFIAGDMSRLVVGATLTPPSADDVFGIVPAEAFRRMRGHSEAIPLSTRNLIDAQLVSRECAAAVGQAQNERRKAGGNALEIAQAGRRVFEEYKAKLTFERELKGESDAGAPAVLRGGTLEKTADVETMGKKPDSAAIPAESEPKPESVADAHVVATATGPVASESAPAPVESSSSEEVSGKGEPTAAAEPMEKPEAAGKATTAEPEAQRPGLADRLKSVDKAWYLLAGLLAAIAGFLLWRRKPEDGESKRKPRQVTIKKRVPETSEAQLKAVSATVGEAIKNGTTAGAMGVGAAAYTEARMEAERAKAAETLQKQPWLDPTSEELPPVDEEALHRTVSDEVIEAAVAGIDLSIGEKRPAEMSEPVGDNPKTDVADNVEQPHREADAVPAETASEAGTGLRVEVESVRSDTLQKPVLRPASAVPPQLSNRGLPAESEARIEAIARAAAMTVDDLPAAALPPGYRTGTGVRRDDEPRASQPAQRPLPSDSEKERANREALDAKLKLAEAFIGLGAVKEALSMLEEVRKQGTHEQKTRAEFLEKRIRGA